MKYTYIIFSLLLLFGFNNETLAQQKKVVVKGTVIDRAKKPMPSVIVMSGKPLVAVGQTDVNGKFSVTVAEDAELTFKFVGYKSAYRKVAGNLNINVTLDEEVSTLKEQVIIGYAKKTKEVSTGSSVIITARDIQDAPVANVMELIQGKVPGLNIQNNNGTPGMRGSVTIRGLSNVNVQGTGNSAFLTPTSPLFVVDGIPIDDNSNYSYGFNQAGPGINPISLIPTEDIQQIEVLKDAQATSLYGSRGSYGVILITTKRGNSKVPIIKYVANFTFDTPPKLRTVIGGKGERLMRIDQIMQNDTSYYHALSTINNTNFLSDSLNAFYNNSTNWQSKYFRNTFNQTHNVDVSGGDNRFNYKVNLGYYGKKGIVENTSFNRYSLNMNTQYQPNDRFKLSASVSNSLAYNSVGNGNSLSQTGIASTGSSSSLLPPPSLFTVGNDLLGTLSIKDNSKTVNIMTNFDIEYEMIKGLRGSTSFSYNYVNAGTDRFKPGVLNNNFNEVYNYYDRKNVLYNRTRLSYVTNISEKHNINAAIFSELNSTNFRADAIQQTASPNDQVRGPLGYDWFNSRGGTLNNLSDARSASLAGSFSYNYDQKYVLDLTYRIDGSSTQGPDAGYSKNPSVGLRWNFYKEEWLKNASTWLDFGSLRFSYGKNINPVGSIYDVYGRYVAGGNYNQKPTVNIDLGSIPNTALIPTSTTQSNLGFEAGFLNGKITLTYDAYYKQVDDQLRSKDLANINAFSKVSTNEMSLVDYGHEVSFSFRPLAPSSKFKWTLGINGALNKDILTHLPDNASQILIPDADNGQAILLRIGRNSLSNVLFNTKGVYATNADVPVDPLTGLRYRTGGGLGSQTYFQAGDPRWTDLNGDYILDQNDYVIVGNSQPLITGGISSFLQYKEWSLSVNGSFTLIRDVLNNALASRFQNFRNPVELNGLVPIEQFNYWKQSGDNATFPNPYDYTRYNKYSPFRFDQTLFQEDGSYFKLNQVTLSYTIDRNISSKWGISSARIYGTAYNLYTFTNYSGPNPESVTDLGRDTSGGYPSARSYILGLQVQF